MRGVISALLPASLAFRNLRTRYSREDWPAEFVPAAVKGIARLSTLPPWRNPFDPAPA
jgi:hypothetical protein